MVWAQRLLHSQVGTSMPTERTMSVERLKEAPSDAPPSIGYPPAPTFISASAGYRIPVRRFGIDGDRRPVVMLHGLQSHSGWFVQSARRIAELGLPVHAFDRCGSGVSAGDTEIGSRLEGLLAEVDAVANHALAGTRHDSVHIVGHCFGAIVALLYAALHRPARVASLVLATPALYTLTDLPPRDKARVLWSVLTGRPVRVPVPLSPEQFSELEPFVEFVRDDPLALRTVPARLLYEVRRARGQLARRPTPCGLRCSSRWRGTISSATTGATGVCSSASRRRRKFASTPARVTSSSSAGSARRSSERSGRLVRTSGRRRDAPHRRHRALRARPPVPPPVSARGRGARPLHQPVRSLRHRRRSLWLRRDVASAVCDGRGAGRHVRPAGASGSSRASWEWTSRRSRTFTTSWSAATERRRRRGSRPEGSAQHTAAWCAVDLALLDTFGRAFGTELRHGLPGQIRGARSGSWPEGLRYSLVLSGDAGRRTVTTLLKARLYGLRDVKVKVDGQALAGVRLARRLLGRAGPAARRQQHVVELRRGARGDDAHAPLRAWRASSSRWRRTTSREWRA